MALELLGTQLTLIARGEVCMRRLKVLSQVVHIPASLPAQQANYATAINGLLAVRLHMLVRICEGIMYVVCK